MRLWGLMLRTCRKPDFSGISASGPASTAPSEVRSGQSVEARAGQMARIFREPIKSEDGKQNLIPRSIVVVEVVSFTFRFADSAQLQQCIAYYKTKTHPSSRIPAKELAGELGEDWREQRGWEVERWFERLPMYLLEEPKRQKVLKALERAHSLLQSGKL